MRRAQCYANSAVLQQVCRARVGWAWRGCPSPGPSGNPSLFPSHPSPHRRCAQPLAPPPLLGALIPFSAPLVLTSFLQAHRCPPCPLDPRAHSRHPVPGSPSRSPSSKWDAGSPGQPVSQRGREVQRATRILRKSPAAALSHAAQMAWSSTMSGTGGSDSEDKCAADTALCWSWALRQGVIKVDWSDLGPTAHLEAGVCSGRRGSPAGALRPSTRLHPCSQ